MSTLPEKIGEIGGNGVYHVDEFIGAFLGCYVTEVIRKGFKVSFPETFTKPCLYELALAFVKMDAALLVNQAPNLLEFVVLKFVRGKVTYHDNSRTSSMLVI